MVFILCWHLLSSYSWLRSACWFHGAQNKALRQEWAQAIMYRSWSSGKPKHEARFWEQYCSCCLLSTSSQCAIKTTSRWPSDRARAAECVRTCHSSSCRQYRREIYSPAFPRELSASKTRCWKQSSRWGEFRMTASLYRLQYPKMEYACIVNSKSFSAIPILCL